MDRTWAQNTDRDRDKSTGRGTDKDKDREKDRDVHGQDTKLTRRREEKRTGKQTRTRTRTGIGTRTWTTTAAEATISVFFEDINSMKQLFVFQVEYLSDEETLLSLPNIKFLAWSSGKVTPYVGRSDPNREIALSELLPPLVVAPCCIISSKSWLSALLGHS